MARISLLFKQFKCFWIECALLSRVLRKFPGVMIEARVMFKGNIDNLKLGKNVQIQSGTILHMGGMPWCKYAGAITIGDDCCISPYCVIYGCGPGGVRIGDRFDCGPNVSIFSSRTDYSKGLNYHVFDSVDIGDDVTVFANVVISPGVVIGSGSAIAAGSVVINDVPKNTLVGGSPARVIRENIR